MSAGVASQPFETMRGELIAQGLLTAEHRLTAAGHARAQQIKRELATAEASNDPDGARVDWQIDFRRRGVPYRG